MPRNDNDAFQPTNLNYVVTFSGKAPCLKISVIDEMTNITVTAKKGYMDRHEARACEELRLVRFLSKFNASGSVYCGEAFVR